MNKTMLSNNEWCVLRDPKQVPERLRRPLMSRSVAASNMLGDEKNLTPEAIDFFSDFNDLLAIAMIESWSFGDAVTVEVLIDLPIAIYDEVRKLVAPFVKDLMPDFSPTVEADSPTAPSND